MPPRNAKRWSITTHFSWCDHSFIPSGWRITYVQHEIRSQINGQYSSLIMHKIHEIVSWHYSELAPKNSNSEKYDYGWRLLTLLVGWQQRHLVQKTSVLPSSPYVPFQSTWMDRGESTLWKSMGCISSNFAEPGDKVYLVHSNFCDCHFSGLDV